VFGRARGVRSCLAPFIYAESQQQTVAYFASRGCGWGSKTPPWNRPMSHSWNPQLARGHREQRRPLGPEPRPMLFVSLLRKRQLLGLRGFPHLGALRCPKPFNCGFSQGPFRPRVPDNLEQTAPCQVGEKVTPQALAGFKLGRPFWPSHRTTRWRDLPKMNTVEDWWVSPLACPSAPLKTANVRCCPARTAMPFLS